MRINKLKAEYQISIRYVYFPLHPGTPLEGQHLAELFGHESLSAKINRLNQFMEAEGLPFDEGRRMTFNSRLAQEIAKWGEPQTDTETLHLALYQAYFVDGLNIGRASVLLDIVEKVGLSRTDARKVIEERTMRQAVDEDWQYARSIGVSSVPTFAVGLTGVIGAQPYETLARLVEHSGAAKRQ